MPTMQWWELLISSGAAMGIIGWAWETRKLVEETRRSNGVMEALLGELTKRVEILESLERDRDRGKD
jgi:hypothetical protein